VRALPDPGPRIVPAHFRAASMSVLHSPEALGGKMKAEAIRGRIRTPKKVDSTCESVRGVISKTPFGKEVEDIVVSALPASNVHSRTPFTPAQLKEGGIICDHCQKPIKAPKMGYWMENLAFHSKCLVDRALLECGGDMQRAAQLYGLPMKALEKRVSVLQNTGKLPVKANA